MFYSRYFLIDDVKDFGGAEMLSDVSKELLYSENGDSLFLRNMFNAGCESSDSEDEVIDQELFDDFWVEHERRKNHRRSKHNKKASRRKGSAKRFRDRSRKAAHEEHLYKVYNRGLAGDWNRRGRRLEDAGATSTTNSHKIVRDIAVDQAPEEETETRTFTYWDDGFTLSMSMSKSAWEKEEEDDFSPSFNWDRKYTPEWDFAENPPTWKIPDDDDDRDWLDWEDEWSDDDDDEIIDEPEPAPKKSSSYDTSEFTAIELAQMSMKLACATPDQRAWIREFMKNL